MPHGSTLVLDASCMASEVVQVKLLEAVERDEIVPCASSVVSAVDHGDFGN